MNINLLTLRSDRSAGGIENTSYCLADSLCKHENVHCTLMADRSSEFPSGVSKIPVRLLGEKRMGMIKQTSRLINVLLRQKEKANFNLCLLWMLGIPCLISRLVTHTPYAVMVYGNEIMKPTQKNVKNRLFEKLRSIIFEKACCIFACSEYTKRLFVKGYTNDNIIVIHPPINSVNPIPATPLRNDQIFSIGRHVERKGFQDVIQAMPKLRQMYPQIRYRLAGDGPYHAELVRLAEALDVSDYVDFLGRITEEQKQEELQACDLFVMTSHTDEAHCEVEGFGVCYLEANACGKWVIARDSGGVADAVVDGVTGRLLPDSDADTICGAVKAFYEANDFDPEKAKAWAARHCADNIAKQYLEYIKKYAQK